MPTPANSIRDSLFNLKRQFRHHQRVQGVLLDIAPWVNIVLLIIFFIITQSATLKKPGLQVNLPVARATSGARYDSLVLTVPQEGVYFFADERVHWAVLADKLREAAKKTPDAELIIEADGSITHNALTGIYNLAVDAGWTKVVLATRIDAPSGFRR